MAQFMRRSYSSSSKPTSPHVMVYKNFGRPFLKIFIGSLVCYQAAYWAWNKLEREDMVHRSGNAQKKGGKLDWAHTSGSFYGPREEQGCLAVTNHQLRNHERHAPSMSLA
ncbi:uncharacterized protein MCYG_07289 [Microsporum canis CBS 113480]|uniref:Uncharacterized protein n=1 Tax=Arthroderma otae (strain ATCC MYA-4605 / CBS 113480) TaxID=554155 RepID=C5FY72_ARTOC|nr:uncharacterized protein MCYG_07289 [Microsporum canis CBS 113480]EEQ34470.1 predicted protein [Microsporum canis CBS 113480]